jgi:hypothetical protein
MNRNDKTSNLRIEITKTKEKTTIFKDVRTKYEGFEVFREIFFFIDEYRYLDYVVHGDIVIAQSAQLDSRYRTESLKGLSLNIHFLHR